MKFLNVAIVMMSLSATVMADVRSAAKEAYYSAGFSTSQLSLFPLISAHTCTYDVRSQKEQNACFSSSTALNLTVTASTSALLKEEIQNVEVDAYDFLAGGELTLALEEVIGKLREVQEDLQGASDVEVVTAMIQSL